MEKPTIKEYIDLYRSLSALYNRLYILGVRNLRTKFDYFGDYTETALRRKARAFFDLLEVRAEYNSALDAFIDHPFSKTAKVTRKDVKRALKAHMRIEVKRDERLIITWR